MCRSVGRMLTLSGPGRSVARSDLFGRSFGRSDMFGSVGRSVGSVDRSARSVGRITGITGRSVGSVGRSVMVGSVDRSVGRSDRSTGRVGRSVGSLESLVGRSGCTAGRHDARGASHARLELLRAREDHAGGGGRHSQGSAGMGIGTVRTGWPFCPPVRDGPRRGLEGRMAGGAGGWLDD